MNGAIVVVSKCPTKGKSKTRLISLLGEEGSVDLAKAMLSDVLLTLHGCVRPKLHGLALAGVRMDEQEKDFMLFQ